jgi:hypothetical protein
MMVCWFVGLAFSHDCHQRFDFIYRLWLQKPFKVCQKPFKMMKALSVYAGESKMLAGSASFVIMNQLLSAHD